MQYQISFSLFGTFSDLSYENVNKGVPHLFRFFSVFQLVSVTVQSLSRVCSLKTKYKLCIENTSV